jgi:PIN domain nuclease of toxin-antitoxin system
VRLLLDTHALLWWATLSPSLSGKARKAIADERAGVVGRGASVWEIATRVRLGKLQWRDEAGTVSAYVLGQGFRAAFRSPWITQRGRDGSPSALVIRSTGC